MAIDDERDLRQRLGSTLDTVIPSPAPVAAVLRKGRQVRARRRAAVAAVLAAVALAAVAIPGLLSPPRHQAPVTPHRTPKVTVTRLSGRVAHGLIAQGTIGRKSWQITFRKAIDNTLCVFITGSPPDCGSGQGNAQTVRGIAAMNSMGSPPRWDSVYGPVRRDVTRISVKLSDGTVLNLRPFSSSGLRWIGLVVPGQLRIAEAVAYSGQRELGYTIPFIDQRGSATFVRWLRPGQTGPARVAVLIGSGVAAGRPWSVIGYAGPWGYCDELRLLSSSDTSCSSVNGAGGHESGVDTTFGSGLTQPRWDIGNTPQPVAYLLLKMSDGSTVRVPVVDFAGVRAFALAITRGQRMVRWGAYDSSGHEVVGGQGSIDRWNPKG
jgi:hypothetical protein